MSHRPLASAVSTVALTLGLAFGISPAQAQQTPVKHPRNKYGSPLDTMMSTRLWTDVPAAKDFVRESRPDPKTLDYTPLTGSDPDRPKARDKANVEALQAELERDRLETEQRGHGPRQPAKTRRAKGQDAR